MSPRVFRAPDEVRAAIGAPQGPGEWILLDQKRIDRFADATGDHQWIHVEPERAAQGPHGGTIAHGFLTLSIIPTLAQELYSLAFGSARINYGSNKVRFPHPVRSGSRLRLGATFVGLEGVPAGNLLTTRFVVEIEGVDKPACVAEALTLLVP
ncbi:MaoC family dehydratase [Rhodococcus sp. ACT016]|uniref:MaoC family dehydratase n=1 Tax=Rhodococcus sp. ACT016 TaxID=3134808 RepID=UPI003D2CDDA3